MRLLTVLRVGLFIPIWLLIGLITAIIDRWVSQAWGSSRYF